MMAPKSPESALDGLQELHLPKSRTLHFSGYHGNYYSLPPWGKEFRQLLTDPRSAMLLNSKIYPI